MRVSFTKLFIIVYKALEAFRSTKGARLYYIEEYNKNQDFTYKTLSGFSAD